MVDVFYLKVAVIAISAASIVISLLTIRATNRSRERWIALGRRYGTVHARRLYMDGRLSADVLARLEASR